MNRFISYCLVILLFGIIQLRAQVPTANLKLWLKADAGTSTTTDGQPVSTWADQSGNSNNATQLTTAYQPTYSASALNGEPAIHFTKTDGSYLTLPTDSVLGIQNSDYEIFIVARTDSSAISFLISSGNVEDFEMHLNGAAGARFIPTGSTYIDEGSSGQYANNAPHIFDAQASSTEGLIRVDGINGGDTLTNVRCSTNSELVLGMRLSVLSYFFTGDISEVLIYNKVLSASDRIIVESYLASKYSISYTSTGSYFLVNNTSDANTGSYNVGTLRYVLNAINTNASSGISNVDMREISGTITLTSALPAINYDTKITGPGASNLTISGNNLYSPFFIGEGISPFTSTSPAAPNVELSNFTISNGYGRGGDGAPTGGGGGAAGMGGALFINAGNVTIDSMVFSGNKVQGGIGEKFNSSAGGGGGFGGNGSIPTGGSSGLLGGTGGGDAGNNFHYYGYQGGFGGGGGAAKNTFPGIGGNGGFGGGGGAGAVSSGGSGGFGGGNGSGGYDGGGGGAGMGGAIFNKIGNMIIENSTFNNNTATGGVTFGTFSSSGASYGGAVFNYSGSYYFSNVNYGTGAFSNSASLSPDYYIYSGNTVVPTASLLPVTNLTGTSATINGSVNTNNVSTTYRFIYGTNSSTLSDTLSLQSVGSYGTVNVSANLTGLTSGTFYYFRLLTSNSYGADTSSLGSFIYDTSISNTNLKLWLASDSGVDTTSGKVTEWFDKSGNNNNAIQSASANEPSLQTSEINSKPALSFDGSATYLTLPSATSLGIQNSNYEIFIVAKSSSTNIQFLEGGTSGNYELQLNGGMGARFIPVGSNYLDEGNNYDYTNGQAHVFELKATSSEGVIHVDGTAGGYVLSNTQSSDTASLNIGRRGDGTYYFNGDIAEMIVYNADLTISQRQTITQYLAQKYSISVSAVSQPTVQASNVSFSNIKDTSMTVTVNKGNGAYRIILAKSGSAVSSAPTDGSVYSASSVFGSGAQIGTGNYVVYNGTDSTVTLTGLSGATTYYFSVFEYNGTNTDQYYLTASPATGSQQTLIPLPTVSLQSDSILSSTSVIFRGTVNPKGNPVTYKFYYGTNINSLNDSTSSQSAGSGSADTSVTATVTGLTYGNLYYVKIAASNSASTTSSSIGANILDTSLTRTNMKLWLRADAGTSTTGDSTKLTTWQDVSGNMNDASQSISGNEPLFRSSAINSKPAISFDGAASYLTLPTTTTLGITNSGYEIFIVAKSSSTNLQFLEGGTPGNYELQLNGGLGARFIPSGSNNLDEGNNYDYTNGQAHIFDLRADTSEGLIRVDGVAGGYLLSNLQSSDAGNLNIGRRADGTYYFSGDVAEMIIYNTSLTSSQRLAVADYLSQKYNTTYTTISKPTVQASNLTFSNVTNNSITLKVNKGNGAYRIIIGKSGSAVDMTPADGQVYTANSAFGSGAQLSIASLANHNVMYANPKLTAGNSGNRLKIAVENSKENLTLARKTKMPVFKTQTGTNTGSGDYVVYIGSDSLVTVTGLNSNTAYYFSVFDFNGTNTDQSYMTASPATGNTTTTYNPPTVLILPDSAKTSSSVYFRGVINPNGISTTYKFLYGTNLSSLTDSTTVQSLGSDTTNDTIRVQITGLAYGTLYYHELLAANSGGTDTSSFGVASIDTSIPGTNLKLWLRSDEGTSSSTDSTSISTWYDLSGNINNAVQTASGNQPLIRTNVINGHPVIRFNGSTSYLNLPSTGTLGIQNSDYEIFIAAKTSYTANPEFLISGANAQYEIHLNGGVGMRFIPLPTSTYLDEGTNAQYSDGNLHVFSVRASSTGGTSRVDGIDGGISSSDFQNVNDVAFILGTRYGSSLPFDGDIAEVIIYNSVLSDSDRNKVEKYLGAKYNVNSGALPVELTTFTASTRSASTGSAAVILKWETATEVNNYGFEVQRSEVSSQKSVVRSWQKVGFVKGAGNSNSPNEYTFIDKNPSGGSSFEYRLKQIDNDGNYKYSNIVDIKIVPAQFTLYQNYPNPFNPTTTIQYAIPKAEHVTLKVYDEIGREVTALVNENKEAGSYKVTFNASNLASGIYFYRITAGSFNNVKKLILLK